MSIRRIGLDNFPLGQRAMAALVAALLVALAFLAVGVPTSEAGVSGQIGAPWGPSEELAGKELVLLDQVGIDPSDGSVYVGNSDSEFAETILRKFSPTGTFEGSVALPGRGYQGIAVDPEHHRFYVIEDTPGTEEAGRILAFKTTPENGELVSAAVETLPLPTGSEVLNHPQEVVVDPSTGDLVVVASELKEEEVDGAMQQVEITNLQRIDVDPLTGEGTVGERFTSREVGGGNSHAIAIDEAGVTYILGGTPRGRSVEQMTANFLPANFSASSTLTAVPGFEAYAERRRLGSPILRLNVTKPNYGPQVAVTTSPTGEDTLFWKAEIENHNGVGGTEEISNFAIDSYSISGESRGPVYGGKTVAGECSIEDGDVAILGLDGGDVAAFDQGTPIEPGETPLFAPIDYRFGPGGSGCPAPAPAFNLESEGHTATSVQSGSVGSTVTFDGAETELNAASSLEGGTWKIEGPEEWTEPVTGSVPMLEHKFRAPGDYAIRLTIEADAGRIGDEFSAEPRTLDVTPDPNLTIPTVTGVTPDDGPTTGAAKVTITGTDLGETAVVKFGDTAVTCDETEATCKAISDTEVVATSPILPVGSVDVHVINGAGESAAHAPADQFTTVLPPTVDEVTPDKGPTTGGTEVTITGTNLSDVTELKFGAASVLCTGTVTTCKVESDTEIKATTPAGLTAGATDAHAVSGTVESPTNGPADQFTAVPAKFTLTVGKGGTGAGSVSSSPGGINCGSACSASFNEHSSVTLTASAASGSTFAGWEGACAGTGTCVLSMDAARSVTALFNIATSTPPPEEHKTPPSETKTTPGGTQTTPGGTTHPGPTPKTKAQILAAQRKAALKKCQKVKGKAKAMCVKKADQIGKPKKTKKGSKKGK